MRVRIILLIALLAPIVPLRARAAARALGDMSGEVRTPDERINIDATLAGLSNLGVDTYYYLVWQGKHDWKFHQEFQKP